MLRVRDWAFHHRAAYQVEDAGFLAQSSFLCSGAEPRLLRLALMVLQATPKFPVASRFGPSSCFSYGIAKGFRGSPSLQRSVSETREKSKHGPADACKWQQNKVDRKLLPHLLLWDRQVRVGKGNRKKTRETESGVFLQEIWSVISEKPVTESHSGTPWHTSFSPEQLLLFLITPRKQSRK